MQVEWYGQSAFRLTTENTTVVIDPFDDVSGLAARGVRFEYPPLEGINAELVLITHEHVDHNGVDTIGGSPAVLRSIAGRLESPIGELLAIAAEHDQTAGTERWPNTIRQLAPNAGRTRSSSSSWTESASRISATSASSRYDPNRRRRSE